VLNLSQSTALGGEVTGTVQLLLDEENSSPNTISKKKREGGNKVLAGKSEELAKGASKDAESMQKRHQSVGRKSGSSWQAEKNASYTAILESLKISLCNMLGSDGWKRGPLVITGGER